MAISRIGTNLILDATIATADIADDAITTAKLAAGTIAVADIADDAITAAKLATNAVVTASIVAGSVTTTELGADAVTNAKIGDNAIDSEHYVDGSIDTVHISDNAITVGKMADLARGQIIAGNSAGNPVALALGSNNYVLTSDGTDIAWAASQVEEAPAFTGNVSVAGTLGVGTTSPTGNAKVHIKNAASGQSAASNNTELTIENDNHTGIQFLTPNNKVAGFWFGDPEAVEAAKFYYSHSTSSYLWNAAATDVMTLSGSLLALTGNQTISGTLGVTGTSTFGGGTSITNAGVLTLEAGGSLTTAASNDLNIVYPDGRSLFIKEASTTSVTIDNAQKVTLAGALDITGDTIASANIRIRGGASTPISGEARLGGHASWGAQIYGYGGTNDISLVNRAGTVAMAVLANSTNITMAGTLGVASTIRVTTDGSASAPCFQVGGDADTGMYQSATNELAFTVAGTKKMHFTTVSMTLDNSLTSGLSMGDNIPVKWGNSNDLTIKHDGSHSYIHQSGTGDLRFRAAIFNVLNAAGDENMIWATQDGEARLYHNGSAKLATTTTGISVDDIIKLGGYSYIGEDMFDADSLGLACDSTESIQFGTFTTSNSTWTEKMRLTNAGNLGIGIAAPVDKLEVYRTSTDQTVGLTLTNNQNGGYGSGIVWRSKRTDAGLLNAAEITVSGENSWNSNATTSSMMKFATQKDGTLTTHMTITKNGKVGIGDTAPQDWLEVRSSGAIGGITISNSAHDQAALSFARSAAATARIFTTEPGATHTGAMHFQTGIASGPALVTAMTIDETQRIGIGTASPGAQLEVYGTSQLGMRVDTSSKAVIRLMNNALGLGETLALGIGFSAVGGHSGTYPLSFITGGWDDDTSGGLLSFRTSTDGGSSCPSHMVIKHDGKIGIGTASPTAKFEVHDDSGGFSTSSVAASIASSVMHIQGDNDMRIIFTENGSSFRGMFGYEHSGSTYMGIWDSGSSSNVTLKCQTGKVVIGGDAVPDELLHIYERDAAPKIRFEQYDSSGAAVAGDVVGGIEWSINEDSAFSGADTVRTKILSVIEGTSSQTALTFYTGAGAAAAAEKMRIDSSGRVMIGSTTDAMNPDTYTSFQTVSNDTPNHILIGADCSDHADNVGIKFASGPNGPTGGGYIQSSIELEATSTSSGQVINWKLVDNSSTKLSLQTGGIYGVMNDTSDIALKENILDLSDGTTVIKALRPRIFDWKTGGDVGGVGTGQAGFVAQEVETVFEEAVSGVEGRKGVKAMAILTHAVKAIQELEARIAVLEG